jgi:hypothetical protein
MIVGWQNTLLANVYVYVDYEYLQNNISHSYTTVFSSYQNETQTIDSLKLYAQEPVKVNIRVEDKYGNSVPAKDTTIVLLTDEKLIKTGWILPDPGTEIGGIVQARGDYLGGDISKVIDGLTEKDIMQNFFRSIANPWNLIIDLGDKYELSQILTNQRYSSMEYSDVQGAYYRGDNVLAYNMYIWDEASNSWVFVSRHNITTPIVKQDTDYVRLGDAGDKTFLYPEEPRFTVPTRYFRYEALMGLSLSEISLFGRKASGN